MPGYCTISMLSTGNAQESHPEPLTWSRPNSFILQELSTWGIWCKNRPATRISRPSVLLTQLAVKCLVCHVSLITIPSWYSAISMQLSTRSLHIELFCTTKLTGTVKLQICNPSWAKDYIGSAFRERSITTDWNLYNSCNAGCFHILLPLRSLLNLDHDLHGFRMLLGAVGCDLKYVLQCF